MADILAGIDEAGMGALAGPMVVAVVVIEASCIPAGVRDSKKLNNDQREELAALIMDAAEFYNVVAAGPNVVDWAGLSPCWLGAVREVARQAHRLYDGEIILDGNRLVDLSYVRPVVKADDKYPAVSAASILAKYTQCCWMDDYHLEFAAYRFDQHHGYGTADHMKVLKEVGPCPAHRKSVGPVKKLL